MSRLSVCLRQPGATISEAGFGLPELWTTTPMRTSSASPEFGKSLVFERLTREPLESLPSIPCGSGAEPPPSPPRGGGDRLTGRREGARGPAPTPPRPGPEAPLSARSPRGVAFGRRNRRCATLVARSYLFIYFQTRGRPSPFNLKLEKPPAVSFLNGRVLPLPLFTLAPASLPRSPTSNHPLPRPPRPPPLTAGLDVGLARSCTLAPSKRGLG